jgi:hypothetical protein
MLRTRATSVVTQEPPFPIRFIKEVGFPVAVAVFLIWFMASQVLGAIQEHSDSTDAWMQQLISISRQICVNVATTAEARSACFL